MNPPREGFYNVCLAKDGRQVISGPYYSRLMARYFAPSKGGYYRLLYRIRATEKVAARARGAKFSRKG